MKYIFLVLLCVFSLSKLYGISPPLIKNLSQPADLYNGEKFFKSLSSLVAENNPGNLQQNPINQNQKNKIEKQGAYIIGYVDEKNSKLFDRRYAIFENMLQKDGTIKPVKIAVVKSMKTPYVQNIQPENLFRTAFYQISGERIKGQNAYLKKIQGTGINLIAGNTFNGFSGTTGRVEYYFSRNLGDMILPGKAGKGLTSLKIYFEAGKRKNLYTLYGISDNFTFSRGSIGFGKDYYPLRYIHWGPFVGYGLESARWDNSDNLISTNFAEFGARLGVNIRHNIQIIGSGTYYLLIDSVLMNGNRDVIEPNFDYYHTFPNRPGLGYSIGLRLML